jgi:type I restriction enzyme S subunit
MSWELKKLNEIVLVKSGKRLPKGHDFILEPTSHPYIRARDIKNGKIKVESPVYINDDTFNIISRYTVSENDVVITIVGANVGDIAIIDSKYDGVNLTENAAKLIPKDINKLSPKFLKYSLFGDVQKSKFQQIAMAAAQPKLGFYKIKDFEINVPNIQTQKRIADILSTYDDLIENNLKRIKLLEQAAQNIYKEWFVNLRFPGYENAVLDTETRLPGGWEEVLMEDIMNVSGGGTPSTKESLYWEEGKVLWFSPTDLNKNNSLVLIDSTKKITELGLKKSSAKLLPQRTILMSSRATIGLFGLFNGDCSTNQGFININPKEESLRYYILFNLKSRVEELIANASGATFKELSKRVFKRMSIVSPNASISTNFYDQVEFFINQTENLEFQNQKLKAARDILLPRLMNRTIKV